MQVRQRAVPPFQLGKPGLPASYRPRFGVDGWGDTDIYSNRVKELDIARKNLRKLSSAYPQTSTSLLKRPLRWVAQKLRQTPYHKMFRFFNGDGLPQTFNLLADLSLPPEEWQAIRRLARSGNEGSKRVLIHLVGRYLHDEGKLPPEWGLRLKGVLKRGLYTKVQWHLAEEVKRPGFHIPATRRKGVYKLVSTILGARHLSSQHRLEGKTIQQYATMPITDTQWQILNETACKQAFNSNWINLEELLNVPQWLKPDGIKPFGQGITNHLPSIKSANITNPSLYMKLVLSQPSLQIPENRRKAFEKTVDLMIEKDSSRYNLLPVEAYLAFVNMPVSDTDWEALNHTLMKRLKKGGMISAVAETMLSSTMDSETLMNNKAWRSQLDDVMLKTYLPAEPKLLKRFLSAQLREPALKLPESRISETFALIRKLEKYNRWNPPLKHFNTAELYQLYATMPIAEEKWQALNQKALKGAQKGSGDNLMTLLQVAYFENETVLPETWKTRFQQVLTVRNEDLEKARYQFNQFKQFITKPTLPEAIHLESRLSSFSAMLPYVTLPEQPDQFSLSTTFLKMLQGDDQAFVQGTLHLMHPSYSLDYVKPLVRNIESQNDQYRYAHRSRPIGHHPNEAEMLLMLHHPGVLQGWAGESITGALTSITYFMGKGINTLPYSIVKSWGQIGFLAHSFQFWRYDTQGKGESLFARYGFKPLEGRTTDKIYGQGFVIDKSMKPDVPLAPKTLIEFRRGYILVSHPDYGSLLIRNSSPVFGRNLLKHPAYYSPNTLSQEELQDFDPARRKDFMPILSLSLYKNYETAPRRWLPTQPFKGKTFDLTMSALLQEVLNLKEDYRKWKFNPQAFKGNVFQGEKSKGFGAFVAEINQLALFNNVGWKTLPVPDLAFVDPNQPPITPHAFMDWEVNLHDRFKLTPERLKELNAYADGSWNRKDFPRSEWALFVQNGINHNAELVMLYPETPKPLEKGGQLKS